MTERAGWLECLVGTVALTPLMAWEFADSASGFRGRPGDDDPVAAAAVDAPEDGVPSVALTARAGRHEVPLQAAGHWWRYVAEVPETRDGPAPLPVVVLLHGSGGSAGDDLDRFGWAALARREGFLAVAPNGLPANPGKPADFLRNPRLWNSGQHPPDRPRSRVDDLAFFDALLADLARRWNIDPSRVYVAGHSNGAAMAFRLAAERRGPDRRDRAGLRPLLRAGPAPRPAGPDPVDGRGGRPADAPGRRRERPALGGPRDAADRPDRLPMGHRPGPARTGRPPFPRWRCFGPGLLPRP